MPICPLDGFLAADAAWSSNPLARVNAICGDAYVPEEASNHEIGASWLGDGLLREGMEFELNYETGGWRLGVTGATIDGFFDVGPQPLFDIPGDTLQVSLLRRWGRTFEAGYRIRANGERLVVVGARPNCPFILPVCNVYHMEPGFVLHTINAAWN